MKAISCSTGEVARTYAEYLRTEHWRLKREELFNSQYFTGKCSNCGAADRLQVHHTSYKMVGNEPLSHLLVLCSDCHYDVHHKAKAKKTVPVKTPSKPKRKIKGKATNKTKAKESKCYVCARKDVPLQVFSLSANGKQKPLCEECISKVVKLVQKKPGRPLSVYRQLIITTPTLNPFNRNRVLSPHPEVHSDKPHPTYLC